MMKRILCSVTAILLLLALFTGCKAFVLDLRGIEEYDGYTSNTTLDRFLLPTETFLTDYTYSESNYHYYESLFVSEHVLVALTYEDEIYEEAKQLCLDTLPLSEVNRYEHNGYVFAENLSLPRFTEDVVTDEKENEINKNYPKHFNMFAYNDTKKTLVFFGIYDEDLAPSDDAALSPDDFVAMLEHYLADCHEFTS